MNFPLMFGLVRQWRSQEYFALTLKLLKKEQIAVI